MFVGSTFEWVILSRKAKSPSRIQLPMDVCLLPVILGLKNSLCISIDEYLGQLDAFKIGHFELLFVRYGSDLDLYLVIISTIIIPLKKMDYGIVNEIVR